MRVWETSIEGNDADYGTHGRTVICDMLRSLADKEKAFRVVDAMEHDANNGLDPQLVDVFWQAWVVAYHPDNCAQHVIDAYSRID
jgi:hypothetical protein